MNPKEKAIITISTAVHKYYHHFPTPQGMLGPPHDSPIPGTLSQRQPLAVAPMYAYKEKQRCQR